MEIIGPLLISTIAGISTVLGSLVIFFKIKTHNINKFIAFCLSFSVSIMILISITDLIPDSSRIMISNYGYFKGIIYCLITLILGAVLITFLNRSIDKATTNTTNNSLYRVGILSMLALMCHNFPEGIATFMSSYKDISLGISLSIAIMCHNIPEGVSIAVPIYYATGSKIQAIKRTLLSGLAEPAGAIIAFIFLYKYINDVVISFILILVAGLMITLSINELFPKALEYREEKWVNLGLFVGFIVIVIQHLIF